jgi:hypothetical protein
MNIPTQRSKEIQIPTQRRRDAEKGNFSTQRRENAEKYNSPTQRRREAEKYRLSVRLFHAPAQPFASLRLCVPTLLASALCVSAPLRAKPSCVSPLRLCTSACQTFLRQPFASLRLCVPNLLASALCVSATLSAKPSCVSL